MSDIVLSQGYSLTHCPNCGVPFALQTAMLESLRASGKSFFCVNGHSMSFSPGEADRLRSQLAQSQQEVTRQITYRRNAEEIANKAQRRTQRLQKRIAAGVCPCCNRTFQDLQRHMKTKHDGYALPAKEQKLLTGAVQ